MTLKSRYGQVDIRVVNSCMFTMKKVLCARKRVRFFL